MRSRAYNKRVEIWQNTLVDNGFGGNTNQSTLLATIWAKVQTVSSKNKSSLITDFGLLDATNYITVTIRKRSDLTIDLQTMFIKYRNVIYRIKSYPENKDFTDNDITFICVKDSDLASSNDLNADLNA